MSVHKSTLRLFKALPIREKKQGLEKYEFVCKLTIPMGFVFTPEVIYNYRNHLELMTLVYDVYGITAESLNASFHKSWGKVKDTPQEELMVEQIAHYLTTYGKEAPLEYMLEKEEQFGVDELGKKIIELPDFDPKKMWNEDYIYIPKEALNIPDWNFERMTLIIIKGYTKLDLEFKLMELLISGIALKEETVKDCVEVAKFIEINQGQVESIKNKEVKIALYDQLGIVPENPVEFLRYVVFKATGETLLIKNKMLTEKIKEGEVVNNLFASYGLKPGWKRLAEIFYRFKPIFLAFRTDVTMKAIINKIRRLAVKYHKPMPEDYLNTVTAKLKHAQYIDGDKVMSELERVNTFRKIRLAYALKYRTKDVDSILYRIRNGKGYATNFSFEDKESANLILTVVLNSIIEDVKKNVNGKRIYIPDYIHYALPATEKQFTGMFPSGTYVTVPKDIIFGINWKNVPEHRVDLDLSVISSEGEKIGWDAGYISESKDILFSGDITDAKGIHGATELFHIKRPTNSHMILYVNYYNFDAEYPVPFKIIVAKDMIRKNLKESYMVNPNDLVAQTNSSINQKMKILGLVVTTPEESKFYFTETYMSGNITARNDKNSEHSRNYLFNFYEDSIDLKDILVKAGAILVNNSTIDDDVGDFCDINLSPGALEKDTIIRLLT